MKAPEIISRRAILIETEYRIGSADMFTLDAEQNPGISVYIVGDSAILVSHIIEWPFIARTISSDVRRIFSHIELVPPVPSRFSGFYRTIHLKNVN